MKLIPLRKEKEFMPIWSVFDDFMDRFFNEDFTENSKLMAVDVIENETEFKVMANLPAILKENIKVTMKNNQLMIEAKHEHKKDEKDHGTIIRSERFTGNYQRIINLPENCNSDNIKAKLENGVLLLTIPKKEPLPKKEIMID